MRDDWSDVLRREPPVLVTGAAGFIGHHLCRLLLRNGVKVVGFDNLSSYYDVSLKRARLAALEGFSGFEFRQGDVNDAKMLEEIGLIFRPARVVHLAAQAGVRHSLVNPQDYIEANLSGFATVLEFCRKNGIEHLVYASSSSVYGGNRKLPFTTADSVDHPVSLYAATKRSNELMAHAYCHLFGFPATGLRFFTVYGPWGRPDMAYWLFAEAILTGRPIFVNNGGAMARDFTYVDDVVEAVARVLVKPAEPDPDFEPLAPHPARSWAPYRLYNVGNRRPESLLDMIAIIEEAVGRKAERIVRPMPPGDVLETWADVDDLTAAVGYDPTTRLVDGLPRFVEWLRWWLSRNGRPPEGSC